MKPHICFVSPYIYSALVNDGKLAAVGGAEVQQALIAKLLVRDGFRVTVLTRDFGQPAIQIIDGLELHKLPSIGARGVPGLRWMVPRLTDIESSLSGLAPDFIYLRCASAYLAPVVRYAKRAGATTIFAGASDYDFSNRRSPHMTIRDWALFRWGLKRADIVLGQNLHQVQEARVNLGIAARLCPNFFSDGAVEAVDFAGPVIWVGAMGRGKRPDLFLDLVERLPAINFEMVGGPVMDDGGAAAFESLKGRASSLPNLVFRGFVPPQEVSEIFDRASLLVNTSPVEGFPNTFLQSWIRGVPTVSFVRPQVDSDESGTIACETLEEMGKAIVRLKSDYDDWHRRSRFVKEVFEKYHSDTAALQCYRSILKPH